MKSFWRVCSFWLLAAPAAVAGCGSRSGIGDILLEEANEEGTDSAGGRLQAGGAGGAGGGGRVTSRGGGAGSATTNVGKGGGTAAFAGAAGRAGAGGRAAGGGGAAGSVIGGRGGGAGRSGGAGRAGGGAGGMSGAGGGGGRAGASGGAGGAGGASLPPTCTAVSHQAHGVPTDLYFLVDRSRSMDSTPSGASVSKWEAVGQAMQQFLSSSDSAGLGAGLGFLPVSTPVDETVTSCEPSDYAVPVVPVDILPEIEPAISKAIAARPVMSGTPTSRALEGSYAYARTRKAAEPNRDVAVVLVTDGLPSVCDDTIDTAAATAGAAAVGSPPIPTYVLGVGTRLDNLNAIARSGGTSSAYLVESGGVSELEAALNAIRQNTISCDYVIPPANGGAFDFRSATVQARIGLTGNAMQLRRVRNASACTAVAGWFYDPPALTSADPTRLTLCPTICQPLLNTPGSSLDIVIPCTPAP